MNLLEVESNITCKFMYEDAQDKNLIQVIKKKYINFIKDQGKPFSVDIDEIRAFLNVHRKNYRYSDEK